MKPVLGASAWPSELSTLHPTPPLRPHPTPPRPRPSSSLLTM